MIVDSYIKFIWETLIGVYMQIGRFRAANLFYNRSIFDCIVTQAQQAINAKAIGLAAGIIGLVAIIVILLATGYLSLNFLVQPQ